MNEFTATKSFLGGSMIRLQIKSLSDLNNKHNKELSTDQKYNKKMQNLKELIKYILHRLRPQ